MPHFCIVVPVRQAEAWIGRCVRSIRRQTVADFRCVVLDDASTDRTLERARKAIGDDGRFLLVEAAKRRFALAAGADGIRRIASDPMDVVVQVDGDDWLRHRRALEVLARVYGGGDIWVTYGSHQRWNGCLRDRLGLRRKRGIARPYPPEILDRRQVRAHPWGASHLRTFRRFLWDAIREEDLRDEDGGWYRTAGDLAILFPMLEMAGSAHTAYVHDMLYVYNTANPLCDYRVAAEDQRRAEARLRRQPPYQPLDPRAVPASSAAGPLPRT